MSDPPDDEPSAPDGEPPADEEYARAYSTGYEDGVRSALREVVQHAVRGHTPQEIRMLAEGRLVRLPQEVDTKRKALLAPPQRTAWGALRRSPVGSAPARSWAPPVSGGGGSPRVGPAQSLLVREPRPGRALDAVRAAIADFPRLVVVSVQPPELVVPPTVQRIDVAPGRAPGTSGEPLHLNALGGLLRDPMRGPGGCLVYLDAIEFYLNLDGPEMTVRFANWATGEARDTGSGLVVSCDPRALDAKDLSRLGRPFSQVL